MVRKLHRTNIEEIMEKCLQKNNIEFCPQYPIRCKYGYIADFFIPKYNMIVECDGEIWHKKGNSRDRKRDGYLKSRGFVILRFKGQQIINNIQQCIEIIKLKGGEILNGKN